MVSGRIERIKRKLAVLVRWLGMGFNILPSEDKRGCVLVFGIAASVFCGLLVLKGIKGRSINKNLTIESIKVPKDIHMKNENTVSEDQLIPVGKFKGEINGEFEAFYLAVDANGKTYINRSIDFSRDAYHKSKGWEEVTKEELELFQKELHFLPARSKGMKP